MKTLKQGKITTAINMLIAISAGTVIGLLLNCFFLPKLIVCGSVAIISTTTEHFLTFHRDVIVEFLLKCCGGMKNEAKTKK